MLQIRDLNRGTFGFVQLALDTETDTQVAIKFIERGEKASFRGSSTGRPLSFQVHASAMYTVTDVLSYSCRYQSM